MGWKLEGTEPGLRIPPTNETFLMHSFGSHGKYIHCIFTVSVITEEYCDSSMMQ